MAEKGPEKRAKTVAGRAAVSDSGIVDKILGNPIIGLSPWIVYSLAEGFASLEVSAAIAFGNALALLLIGWVRGSHPKLLEYSDVTFFGALAIVIAFASDDTKDWLVLWGGEVANVALVVVAFGSILIRDPFTLAYAKESAPRDLWDNPAFLRTNYILTWVWALAFGIEAASGFIGDQLLENSNNIWTGWIVQTLPLIWAAQFTLWYPDRVEAKGYGKEGPPISEFLGQAAPWITIAGVISLFVGGTEEWISIGLIVFGAVATRSLTSSARKAQPGS